MAFDLKDKVAIVTGGASGIGLALVKELLQNGAKGVTIADIDSATGEAALEQLQEKFATNKIIFVKTDVTNKQQFEDAFKKTVDTFKNVDVLINSAGIFNDSIWEKEIEINLNGTIRGILLGLENYLQRYKQGPEAVIVNISSAAGMTIVASSPIYCATKAAIIALTRNWGDPVHYDRSKVRLIVICPGATATPLLSNASGKNLGEPYEKWLQAHQDEWAEQEPEYLAQEVVKLIKNSKTGTVWVVEGGEPAYEYVVPERETMKQ